MKAFVNRSSTPIRQFLPLKSHRKNYSTDISSTSSKPLLTPPTSNKFEMRNERNKGSKSSSQCQNFLEGSKSNRNTSVSKLKSPIYSSKSIVVQHQLAACRMLESTLDLSFTRIKRNSLSQFFKGCVSMKVPQEKIANQFIKSKEQRLMAKIFGKWAFNSHSTASNKHEIQKIENFRRKVFGRKLISFIKSLLFQKKQKNQVSSKSEIFRSENKRKGSENSYSIGNSVEIKVQSIKKPSSANLKKNVLTAIIKKEISSQKVQPNKSNSHSTRSPVKSSPSKIKNSSQKPLIHNSPPILVESVRKPSSSSTPKSPFKKSQLPKKILSQPEASFGNGNESHGDSEIFAIRFSTNKEAPVKHEKPLVPTNAQSFIITQRFSRPSKNFCCN